MEVNFAELLGLSGSAVLIISYTLLQFGKLKPSDLTYTLCNALGAGMILISLFSHFNLAAFIIEIFWLGISLIGIVRFFIDHRSKKDNHSMQASLT